MKKVKDVSHRAEGSQVLNFIALLHWYYHFFTDDTMSSSVLLKIEFQSLEETFISQTKIFDVMQNSTNTHSTRIRIVWYLLLYFTIIIHSRLHSETWQYHIARCNVSWIRMYVWLIERKLVMRITLVRDTDSCNPIHVNRIYKYIKHIRRIYGKTVCGISKVRFPAVRYISVFLTREKWICRLIGAH